MITEINHDGTIIIYASINGVWEMRRYMGHTLATAKHKFAQEFNLLRTYEYVKAQRPQNHNLEN